MKKAEQVKSKQEEKMIATIIRWVVLIVVMVGSFIILMDRK
jgi:ribosomal protein S19